MSYFDCWNFFNQDFSIRKRWKILQVFIFFYFMFSFWSQSICHDFISCLNFGIIWWCIFFSVPFQHCYISKWPMWWWNKKWNMLHKVCVKSRLNIKRGLVFIALYNYLVCKNYCLTRILNQGHFWDPLVLPYWWVAQFSRNPFKIFMSLLCYSVMITFDLETWESDLVSYFYWYLIFESQKS